MDLKDFSLMKEDQDHYIVGHPKGRSIRVPKTGLTEKAHQVIQKLKKHQNFSQGTDDPLEIEPVEDKVKDVNLPEGEKPLEVEAEGPVANADMEASNTQAIPVGNPESLGFNPASSIAQAELQNAPQAQPQTQPQATQTGSFPNTGEALQTEEKGVKEALSTEKTAGKEAAKAYGTAATAIQNVPTADQRWNEYKANDQRFMDAIEKGHVDPNRYIQNMSTGSKIASSLGLILGGIGSAITGQPNIASQQLQNAINQDIEAQKNDQSKNMNLWKMNMEAYGNRHAADLATQNQLLTIAEVKAKQAMATVPSAQAQAALSQTIGQLEIQKSNNAWMQSRLTGGAPGTEKQHQGEIQAMKMLNPAYGKDMEEKYIPGVGVAQIKPSEKQKEDFISYKNLQDNLSKATHFQAVKAGIGTLPGTALNAEAQNIRNSMIVELNKIYGLNRLNEHEYNNFTSQVPDVGSFFQERSLSKLENLRQQLQTHESNLRKGLGIVPFQKAANDQQAMEWAQMNPNDPRAMAILSGTRSGQWSPPQ